MADSVIKCNSELVFNVYAHNVTYFLSHSCFILLSPQYFRKELLFFQCIYWTDDLGKNVPQRDQLHTWNCLWQHNLFDVCMCLCIFAPVFLRTNLRWSFFSQSEGIFTHLHYRSDPPMAIWWLKSIRGYWVLSLSQHGRDFCCNAANSW